MGDRFSSILRNDELMFIEFKNSMKHKFDMMDLGKMRYFLGLGVLQRSIGVFINQKKYALKVLQRYMENPTELHLSFGIFYRKGGDDELGVYIDSDYTGDLEDRKSTSEAEFAAALCACQAVWLKRVLGKLGQNQGNTQELLADVMTKPLKLDVLLKLQGQLGVYSEIHIN
ncbi:hypothetical protein EZV62_024673 [Acer yangbiense]|uniref:Reverse transcriptase Ty1/copia-type domain-containing protein n=1 Tax=Acer yangbiense TaxID=1000413 RepID=A0A5C7GVQ6_9ROSI|nr:hypothetical protein EZV62_024673 [Acer yangbiense]